MSRIANIEAGERMMRDIADALAELKTIMNLPNCINCAVQNTCKFVPDVTDPYPVRVFCPLHQEEMEG